MIDVYEDEAEFCQNAKDCEASFHKSCLVKYDLEPMFEDLALTKKCIKCCTLKPEDEVDMDDTLSGMNFVVDTKRDADEKTIRAFGGTWSREVNPEKASEFYACIISMIIEWKTSQYNLTTCLLCFVIFQNTSVVRRQWNSNKNQS